MDKEPAVTPEKKQSVIKGLGVLGLLGVIILSAWLAVQVVQVLPNALTSLASLASSVYNYNPLVSRDLVLAKNESVINLNEPLTVSWELPNITGNFVFSYTCVPGVTIDLATDTNDFTSLTCGEKYNLGTSTTLTITPRASETRFLDVPYKIAFYRPNSDTPALQAATTFTLLNESLALVETLTETPPVTETVVNETIVETPPPTTPVVATTTVTTPAPTTPTPAATTTAPLPPRPTPTPPPAPTYIYTYTYGIPVSDPNGITNLVVNLVDVGTVNTAGIYTPTPTRMLRNGVTNGLRFSVHNIGTRTSEVWSYEITLPSGAVHRETNMSALKPNERSTITVVFPLTTNNYVERYTLNVTTARDQNLANNRLDSVLLVNRQ